MILPDLMPPPAAVSGNPLEVLADQLEAWRAMESREETPCLSGVELVADDGPWDEAVAALLGESVAAKIVRQLRRDRRVVRAAAHRFVWLSSDTHPDDGLRPVERIRQMLDSTQFRHGDRPVPVRVLAAIVAVLEKDSPEELLARLDRALVCAREGGAKAAYIDRGDGPQPGESQRLEVAPSECILV